MRRFHDEDLTGAEFRECDLSRARMVGVVMQDAEIDGLVTNLVVNGVEVMSYVEAELDRRHPVRLLIRSDQPDDLREAWRQLRDDWATTIERVRSMPENSEHHGVDGEWSMVETLRHLVFVHDSWFRRCVLGLTEPFTAMGLGPSFVMEREDDLDPSAQPSLDEVLAVRVRQASEIETWLAEVTPDQLARTEHHVRSVVTLQLLAEVADECRVDVPGGGPLERERGGRRSNEIPSVDVVHDCSHSVRQPDGLCSW